MGEQARPLFATQLYNAQCKNIFSIRDHPPTTLLTSIVRTEIGKNHDASWHNTSGPTSAKLNNRFIDLRFVSWRILEPGTYSSNTTTQLHGSSRISFASAAYTSCNAGLSLISMAMSRLGLQNSQMNCRPSVVGNASLCCTKFHRAALASLTRLAEPANKSGRLSKRRNRSRNPTLLTPPVLINFCKCSVCSDGSFANARNRLALFSRNRLAVLILCHGAIVFKSMA